MAVTRKSIEDALGFLIVEKGGLYFIDKEYVDAAVHRISSTFTGCYAYVKPAGKLGNKLVIGNVGKKRLGPPRLEIYIKNDK